MLVLKVLTYSLFLDIKTLVGYTEFMLPKSQVNKMKLILEDFKSFIPEPLLIVEDESDDYNNPHYSICIKTPALGAVDFIIEAQTDRVIVSCSYLSKGIEIMEFIDIIRKQFPDFLIGSYFHHSHKTGEILYDEEAKQEYIDLLIAGPEALLEDLTRENEKKGQLIPFPKKPKGDDPTFN